MKNYQQTIINILIIVALCVLIWVVVMKPSNAVPLDNEVAVKATVVTPEPVPVEPGAIPIPMQELAAMAKPVAPKDNVIVLDSCGMNDYAVNCDHPEKFSLTVIYSGEGEGDGVDSFWVARSTSDMGHDYPVQDIDFVKSAGNTCDIAFWERHGAKITKDGFEVYLENCHFKGFKAIDFKSGNKTYRIKL